MKMLELKDTDGMQAKLIVRSFGDEDWETKDLEFRIEWKSILTDEPRISVDVSVSREDAKRLIKFLDGWLKKNGGRKK